MRNKNKFITLFIAILIVIVFLTFIVNPTFVYEPRLVIVMQYVAKYIEANNGQFPETSERFMKFTKENGDSLEALKIEDFVIEYGFSSNFHEIVDGKLFDQDGNEVFLVTGPYNYSCCIGSLRRRYRIMSTYWFSLMNENSSRIN